MASIRTLKTSHEEINLKFQSKTFHHFSSTFLNLIENLWDELKRVPEDL